MTEDLVSRLRARMAEAGTNATQVAAAAGLGKTAVRDILAGKSKRPTMDTIGRIAKVLDCTVAYLIGDVAEPHQLPNTDWGQIEELTVFEIIEAGVFKRDTYLKSLPKVPVYGYPARPDHELRPFLVRDNSMAKAGILDGDIAIAAIPPGDGPVPVEHGHLLVCARIIIPPHVTEVSIRKVVKEDETINLVTLPVEGAADLITISHRPNEFPSNLYVATDGSGVTIEGRVIRIVRELG